MKKVLHILWGSGIILLTLFLFLLSPVLWPVYLGIIVLHPDLFWKLYRIRVF